ncbi:MAG: laccase domain-containing protein [Oscillospiraceae bacterium]|nr:laccase domain-containing protein [Oscillospiraceae bacterium]
MGEEVREMFLEYNHDFEKYMYRKGEKTHIDLNDVNTAILVSQGICKENIFACGVCNGTELNLPSYRRDKGMNGVMGGVIYKK